MRSSSIIIRLMAFCGVLGVFAEHAVAMQSPTSEEGVSPAKKGRRRPAPPETLPAPYPCAGLADPDQPLSPNTPKSNFYSAEKMSFQQ